MTVMTAAASIDAQLEYLTVAGWVALTCIAAMAFAGLALNGFTRRIVTRNLPYAAALLVSALWLVVLALTGPMTPVGWIAEAARNLLWLWFMASIAGRRADGRRITPLGWIYIMLFGVEAMLATVIATRVVAGTTLVDPSNMLDTLQMLFASGAIVLVHNLYDAARPEERRALSLPLAALAIGWGYDLNLYAISYLSGRPASLLIELRPMLQFAMAALMLIAMARPQGQALRLSRPVAFRSLGLGAVCAWLALLALFAAASGPDADFAGRAQLLLLIGGVVGLALFVGSPRLRAIIRVWAAKHFFEHRYDYRAEWLRFSATMNRPESGGLAIDAHCVKAFADMVESPGGVLIAMEGSGDVVISGAWPRDALAVQAGPDWAGLFPWLASSERIVQFDEIRRGAAPAQEVAVIPPDALANRDIWIAVPLLHLDRVEGVVLLARPLVDRALDWEDFDLLKVAGRQAASHLAEARGARALSESERFEEFHRRFAFMMHDVKNLASQMALLSRNAERHGDNPDFREDMVETLRLSSERLSQLMERLSGQERVRVNHIAPVDVTAVARRVALSRQALHPVDVAGARQALALADAETLEQLLLHLVQNAIDASDQAAPIVLHVADQADGVTIAVQDHGSGMSAAFMRNDLFRPFSSTKEGGFGIGAYQARQLAHAMGGSLTVTSREGIGTTFTLTLRAAESRDAASPSSNSEAA